MRRSSAAICFQFAPPSSERYSPNGPMRNIRCAFVFAAIATHVRPASAGSPPPLISVHVAPWSVDLYIAVPLGGGGAAAAPPGVPDAPAGKPPRAGGAPGAT